MIDILVQLSAPQCVLFSHQWRIVVYTNQFQKYTIVCRVSKTIVSCDVQLYNAISAWISLSVVIQNNDTHYSLVLGI